MKEGIDINFVMKYLLYIYNLFLQINMVNQQLDDQNDFEN